MKAIVGRKMGMTQVFAEDGTMYPVTVIEVLPNVVTQVKTLEKDGYEAIQVGYEEKKEHRANKAEKGIFAKAGTTPKYVLKELKGDEMTKYGLGDLITCDIFQVGERVDVIGTSKGKGFTGAIKRWHFTIGPKGHGSGYHRGVGSMGSSADPSHVFKNKKMAGQYGNERVTIQNLEIAKVDAERNLLLIKGAIPGAKGSLVFVKSAVKK